MRWPPFEGSEDYEKEQRRREWEEQQGDIEREDRGYEPSTTTKTQTNSSESDCPV